MTFVGYNGEEGGDENAEGVLEVSSVHAARPAERLLHEPLLGEACPPLGGLPIRGVEHLLTQALSCLVPQLQEVLPHQVGSLWTSGSLVHSIQGEPRVSRDVEPCNCQAVHLLKPLRLAGTLLQLLQALCDVEGQVDEHPV